MDKYDNIKHLIDTTFNRLNDILPDLLKIKEALDDISPIDGLYPARWVDELIAQIECDTHSVREVAKLMDQTDKNIVDIWSDFI